MPRPKPKPRPSRAKPKRVKTCPICATTFKATRSTQRFCSKSCWQRDDRDKIPSYISKEAAYKRQQRTERNTLARRKRDEAKRVSLRHRDIVSEAHKLWVKDVKASWQVEIESSPDDLDLMSSYENAIETMMNKRPPERYIKQIEGLE